MEVRYNHPVRGIAWLITATVGCGRAGLSGGVDGGGGPDGVDAVNTVAVEAFRTGEILIGAADTVGTASLSAPLDRTVLFVTIRETEPSPAYGSVMCQLLVDSVSCVRPAAGTDYASGSTGEIHIRWTAVTFTRGVTVQRGLAIGGSGVNVVTEPLAPVATDTSFVLLGGSGSSSTNLGWGENEFVRGALLNTQQVEIRTSVASVKSPWQVVTWEGAQVQRGPASMTTTQLEVDVPIAPVTVGQAFPLLSYTVDISSGDAAQLMVSAELTTSSNLHLVRRAGGSNLDLSWEVVSLPLSVATGNDVMPAGTAISDGTTSLGSASSVVFASGQAVLGQSGGNTSFAGGVSDLIGEGAATFTMTPTPSVEIERSTSSGQITVPWIGIDFSR